MEGADDEPSLLPLRLQVGPADDPVAAEEGEHVVAVPPLRRGLVDLDQVVEAEDPAREGPVPEEVVERGEQDGGRRGGQVELGVRGDEHVGAAVVHPQPPEVGLGDELVEDGPHSRDAALQPPVLLDAGLGEDATGADGPLGQCAQHLVLGRRRRVERARGITRSASS